MNHMKNLTLLLLLSSSLLMAQPKLTAGDELIKANDHFYRGMKFGLVGITVGTLGFIATENKPKPHALVYAGSILSLIGTIFIFESVSHIGKAGVILNLSANQLTATIKF